MGKSGDSRFLKKILTDAEIEDVKNADNPDMALWSLWACKETAYKVIKKYLPDTAFVPRRWQTVFTKSQSKYSDGEVTIPEKCGVYIRLFCETQILMSPKFQKQSALKLVGRIIPRAKLSGTVYDTPESCPGVHTRYSNPQYVHCIGANSPASLDKLIWRVEALPEEKINPSIYLRCLLRQNLAQCLSLNFDQIKIKRTKQNGELQPPTVYIDGRKTDIDISLSHDGRFVAYAYHL